MSFEIFTILVNHEVLASLRSCFENSKIYWIIGLEDSVASFQYFTIPERYQNIHNNPEYDSVSPFRIILKKVSVKML